VDRTYKRLLGTLDAKELTVWAECLFVDPIADLAVLGVPDVAGGEEPYIMRRRIVGILKGSVWSPSDCGVQNN